MIRPYEAVIVFDGTLPEETFRAEQDKIEQFLRKNGEYERTDAWGKQPLAYEIRKRRTGNFSLFLFKGEKDMVGRLEKELRLNPAILRFLCVVRNSSTTTASPPSPPPAPAAAREESANA